MNYWKSLAAIVLTLGLVGCIPSLYPLYTPRDLVQEPQLAGTWFSAKRNAVLTFKPGKAKSLDLTFSEEGKTDHFEAHLLRLGGRLFLDTFPAEGEIGGTDFYRAHFVPAHQFSKVTLQQNTLNLEFANLEYLAKKDTRLRREGNKENSVLAAPTQELQALLIRYADDKKAFENSFGPLVRRGGDVKTATQSSSQ